MRDGGCGSEASEKRGKAMAKQYYILIVALLLTSCASPSSDISDIKAVPEGKVIVFGRVKVISEGERWIPYRMLFLHVLSERGPKPNSYELTGDGTFFWHLSPGGYTITEFAMMKTTLKPTEVVPVFADFVISEGTSLVYIGTLKITLETDRYLISIEDEYGPAWQGFKNKFPEFKGDATKSLMHLGP